MEPRETGCEDLRVIPYIVIDILTLVLLVCQNMTWLQVLFCYMFIAHVGRESVFGIATRYSLDVPGIKSRWGTRFSAPVQSNPFIFLYNEYRDYIPGVEWLGRGVDLPPSH
jgi:hypothetical protein